ncbi:MAG: hypothetical protein LBR62_02475 [Puniceicoccales bacterium]|jgi:hypothetical protein|nr:hypothetical protein [Puniceicoccales bacterium]
MNRKEHLRCALLLQLEAAYPLTLPFSTLWQGLALAGYSISSDHLLKEIEYLHEKKFLQVISRDICPQNKRYKLNPKGKDYLEAVHLI